MLNLKTLTPLFTVVLLLGLLWAGKDSLHSFIEHNDFSHPAKPNFGAFLNIDEKKKAFFDYLYPFVEETNQQILEDRQQLKILSKDPAKIDIDNDLITTLSQQYDLPLPKKTITQQWLTELLKRVNIIPAQLVLAQAALESSWGTSRFAEKGNNYFGEWCFTKGCGIPPLDIDLEHYHEVKSFPSVHAAIASYFNNINTNDAYSELRNIRAKLQQDNQPITAQALAHGLLAYSQIGHQYIQRLLDLINSNKNLIPTKSSS